MFCETRPLAQEWAYRFLGAAVEHLGTEQQALDLAAALPSAGPLPTREPTSAEVRAWAQAEGLEVADRGRIPASIRAACAAAHP